MTYDPYIVELLQATGLLNVKPDPNDSSRVLVSASPKLVEMIEARGVTLDDFSNRPLHPTTT